MLKAHEIVLTKDNWQKIDELLALIPDSEFLRFCLMNGIIEEGMKKYEEFLNYLLFKH